MSVIYKKATTREQVIKYIRELDINHIKNYGTVLVLPYTDKETKKIIVKELKRLGIYNKVKIVETNDVKKMYQKMTKIKVNKFYN